MIELNGRGFPTRWKEFSFDFKLSFLFHGCMMLLFAIGGLFSIQILAGVVGILFVTLAGRSLQYRLKSGWRWPGVRIIQVIGMVLSVVFLTLFIAAPAFIVSPLNPRFFPWFAAGGGLIIFGALAELNVISLSESEFQSRCGKQARSAKLDDTQNQ